MKAVLLLFDSLNRLALEAYGSPHIVSPNSRRLAERAVRFDNHYVGSMPCMPARRDLQTGRLNFLHRSWGPLEPYDTPLTSLLRQSGIYTHLVSDHFHYFTEGGATYHTQFSSWDFIRGQEADRWKAMVQPPLERFRERYHRLQFNLADDRYLPHMVNREFIREESDFRSSAASSRPSSSRTRTVIETASSCNSNASTRTSPSSLRRSTASTIPIPATADRSLTGPATTA